MPISQILQHSTEIWLGVGLLGSILEAIGEAKKWPGLAAIGVRLEALSVDFPKLWRGSRMTNAVNSALGSQRPVPGNEVLPEEPK